MHCYTLHKQPKKEELGLLVKTLAQEIFSFYAFKPMTSNKHLLLRYQVNYWIPVLLHLYWKRWNANTRRTRYSLQSIRKKEEIRTKSKHYSTSILMHNWGDSSKNLQKLKSIKRGQETIPSQSNSSKEFIHQMFLSSFPSKCFDAWQTK
jgi:hypothetical protein